MGRARGVALGHLAEEAKTGYGRKVFGVTGIQGQIVHPASCGDDGVGNRKTALDPVLSHQRGSIHQRRVAWHDDREMGQEARQGIQLPLSPATSRQLHFRKQRDDNPMRLHQALHPVNCWAKAAQAVHEDVGIQEDTRVHLPRVHWTTR